MSAVLVVAAHPDDEVLGAGGVIAKHAAAGDPVHVLILGEGVTSRFPNRDAALSAGAGEALTDLTGCMRDAHRVLGVAKTHTAVFPDNRFDSVDLLDIVKVVEKVKAEARPATVYTHHPGDLNIDHRLTCEAVLTACRALHGDPVLRILGFETLSSTEWAPAVPGRIFAPNVFIGIESVLSKKLEAMRCYTGELKPAPHPRSLEAIEHQARLWGMKMGVGQSAEAFMLLRERTA